MSQDEQKLSLYLAHRAALVEYATPIVGDRMRAEDVVQEAYLRFAPAAGGGEGPAIEQPVAYLYRIVRNLALDLRRHLSADRRRDDAHQVIAGPEPLAPSPEEAALYRDELRLVEAVLADLPEPMRRAFELHRFADLTFQQIGVRLGVSTATAARWTQDVLIRIARRLEAGAP